MPAALATKRETREPGIVNRLDAIGSGTTRNAVEGRQPNDRREAGVPVAEHRDRPCATGPAATNRRFHRNLPMCLAILAERRQPISVVGINHSLMAAGPS